MIMRVYITKALNLLGLSWHDLFIVTALLETCWFVMFAFVDGADVVLRIDDQVKVEYHPFLLVQKIVSTIKLFLSFGCLWWGTIFMGKSIFLQAYLVVGIAVDIMLILTWNVLSIEEAWPLSPANILGLHYILTFGLIRSFVYAIIAMFLPEIRISPFGIPPVGTMNGHVVGIPDRIEARSVGSASNMAYFGKGYKAVLEYYRVETEKAFLIALIWDIFWNFSIIISQELPETIYNIIFIGIFGSLALNIPTEHLAFRCVRVIVGLIGLYMSTKKIAHYIKYWSFAYIVLMFANMIFFCFVASTIVIEETTLAIAVLMLVFLASNFGKLFVLFCAGRYYVQLKIGNSVLINENSNNNNGITTSAF